MYTFFLSDVIAIKSHKKVFIGFYRLQYGWGQANKKTLEQVKYTHSVKESSEGEQYNILMAVVWLKKYPFCTICNTMTFSLDSC